MTEQGPRMPAEWAPHARTWMAWPARSDLWGDALEEARLAYAGLADAIADFEPVTMIARPDLVAEASLYCGKGVKVLSMPHDDSWTRDTGATFVELPNGGLGAVCWRFDGWGGAHPGLDEDARMAGRMAAQAGALALDSLLVLEGGGIHVDGEGTALLCEGSVLDPKRNPGIEKAQVEAELGRLLGVTKAIWLPSWLEDDETRGHIDNLACFAAPGKVVALDPATARDADREGLVANLDCLREATDAQGRRLEITTLPLPKPQERQDGRLLTRTYINFYLCNGAVVVPSFDDGADQKAFRILAALFPDREPVQVEANPLLEGGGGIHCVTQQQPGEA